MSKSAFACLISLSLSLLACRTDPQSELRRMTHSTGVKVLIIGIDGLSPRLVERFIHQGGLDATRRLIERGSHGVLLSENPTISPALWTTIATGRSRRAHGVKNFVTQRDGGRSGLVGSHDRRTHALWTMASAAGRSVGFAGWWATWPAEAVNGWMVSDRMAEDRWTRWTKAERGKALTFPESLGEDLVSQIVHPMSLVARDVLEIVELQGTEIAEFDRATEPVYAHAASVLKFAYASQLSLERMTETLLARGQPDLASVFLIANDPISHTFWHYFQPAAFPPFGGDLEPRAIERLGQAIPNIYRHNDAFIARLQTLVSPETVILVVSDHGFEASKRLPKAQLTEEDFRDRDAAEVAVGQTGYHTLRGAIIAAGGPIRQGAVPKDATIHDIAPTVLALLGLPIGEDMDGRVLDELIDPAFLARFPVRRIPSYETLLPKVTQDPSLQDEDQERLEMLRSLGYIQ